VIVISRYSQVKLSESWHMALIPVICDSPLLLHSTARGGLCYEGASGECADEVLVSRYDSEGGIAMYIPDRTARPASHDQFE